MARLFAFVFTIFILISSCATGTAALSGGSTAALNRSDPNPSDPNPRYDGFASNPELRNSELRNSELRSQIVYVDHDFSAHEAGLLSNAAEEWFSATKGMVQFTFIWDYPVYDKTFEESPYRNTVIKTWSSDDFVGQVDSSLEAGKIALAFLHRPNIGWPYWSIGLVRDRVDNDMQIKSVFEHELGHAIGLDHRDDERSIMSSAADDRYGCLTRHDLLQFCNRYGCDVDRMNYCIPKPAAAEILASRNNP